MASVEIPMATFNSARYLRQMMQSPAQQTFRDFRLTVSDDCSTDDTLDIIEAFAPRFAVPPRVIRRDRPSGGAKANFSSLRALSEGDHVLLADHDDVWRPDRVARATTRLARREAIRVPATPVSTHTDMRPVNADLRPRRTQRNGVDEGTGCRREATRVPPQRGPRRMTFAANDRAAVALRHDFPELGPEAKRP